MSAPQPYRSFKAFKYDRPSEGVLRLWIDTGVAGNGVTHDNHREFGDIWRAVGEETDVRAVVVRGTDDVFCSGGDPSFLEPLLDSQAKRAEVYEDIRTLVLNMIDCPKPIVSAIMGYCSGAGLAVGVMADVSIATRDATLQDAHVIAGVACGDHAALAWPLLMGMAKTKYYLLTAGSLTGEEAERYGLVTECVDGSHFHERTLEVAARLASLPAEAVALTKRSLNGWFRLAQPIFEQSAAFETLGFSSDTARNLVKDWQRGQRTFPRG